MDSGKLEQKDFTETIRFDDPLDLVIIPVSINGTIYRFLFDTGAPNVISVELQQKYRFESITKKSIRDSEGKTQKVRYIKLDSVLIGNIKFQNTAAFITDLKANPVLDCLDLDGIIGSNLMRFCTWQVDYSSRTLVLTDQPEQLSYSSNYHEISFHLDDQHSIKIDFKTPNAKIKNLKIDYGSTGSIGVPNKVYKVLKERGDLSEQQIEVGFTQSGIFGDFLVDTTESSVIQFGHFGDFKIGKTEIENDGKGLLGTSILKNYIVTMNWQNRTIGFDETGGEIEFERNTFGFSPTFNNEKTIVKSVIVEGPAFKAGLQPGMQIQSIDEFSVEDLEGFCEYVLADRSQRDTLFVKAIKNDILETFRVVSNKNRKKY
jgi:Aspartyl protease